MDPKRGSAPKRWSALLLALALLAGCGGSTREAGTSGTTTPPAPEGDGGWIGEDEDLAWTAGRDEAVAASEDGAVASTVAAPEAADAAGPGGGELAEEPVDVGLNAGWVDDNEAWDDYLRYRDAFAALGVPVDDVPIEGRRIVTVVDESGRPVLGARVVITDEAGAVVHDGLTHADGRTLAFPPPGAVDDQQRSPSWNVRVEKAGAVTEAVLGAEDLALEVELAGVARTPLALDVLFLIDTTGSMSDEIERLKAHMISVAEQIAALPAAPDLRLGMTVYRDAGDLFVTRTFDFTSDVPAFTAALAEVVADGGGDTPEALDEALAEALAAPSWRHGDTVSLVFLLADAPPHIGDGLEATPDSVSYATSVLRAVADGVKIFPIASSGADPQAEFVFRQLAQITDAPFVFLTYGADGASPGDLTDLSVEDYSVLPLDELVVQLVADELAPQL